MRSLSQLTYRPWIQWVPALLWIGLIAVESTDLLSPKHTGHCLALVLTMFRVHLEQQKVLHLNLILRNIGHFIGYGVQLPSLSCVENNNWFLLESMGLSLGYIGTLDYRLRCVSR